jgi:PAS domain S-box-containing protein
MDRRTYKRVGVRGQGSMTDKRKRAEGKPATADTDGGAPDALRAALDRLSLALSATGLGVWERELATRKVTWSDTMHRLFGRTPEQFSGSPDEVLSFVHPEDRKAFQEAHEGATQGESDTFEHEFRIVRPDGEVRWVYQRGQVRRGGNSRAHSVLGVAFDITDRKQAEAANARLAAIVSAADDAIMGLAPDGTVLAWNPAAERMFGYLAAEAIGQSARLLYPEAAAPEFESNLQRVRAGEPFQGERVYVGKAGTELDVAFALSPVLGTRGHVVGVSAVVRDISERRRTEQKLVETLALLLRTNNQRELALTAGRMGTFEVDLEHDIVTWSDEIYQQVGVERTSPTLTATEVAQFIHTDDRAQVAARRAEAYRSGQTYENEFRIVRPDGEIRWLYVRAQALDGGGKPTRAYGVSMDITERKEREAHIRFLMREVSHRSKNLLAVVQAIASQTARATSSPLDFATDFGGRLKSLAASLDLLVREEWRGVSVKELVESQLGHYGDSEGRRVEMEGPQLLLSPLAAQYLGMALHELSTNAVKYGALSVPAGKVLIAWRVEGTRGRRRLHFSWLESGGPPVAPPTERGFGHMVIERMAAEALQGQVKLEFPREGLRWHLDADAAAAIKEG